MNERDERLARRLGTPLQSERAAVDRNWHALSAAIETPAPGRPGVLRAIVTTLALGVVVLAGLGWWSGARVDVAGDRLPVLYREEVARTTISAAGIEATLAIQQKHIESDPRLRVVGVADVRLSADRLPATIELRFLPTVGGDTYGVLAHSEVSDPRRATGTTRTLYEAPFPPLGSRERATYRVWLHVETATGPTDSPVVVIQVTDRPEGQRAGDGVLPTAP